MGVFARWTAVGRWGRVGWTMQLCQAELSPL